jgi:hypothetical protein
MKWLLFVIAAACQEPTAAPPIPPPPIAPAPVVKHEAPPAAAIDDGCADEGGLESVPLRAGAPVSRSLAKIDDRARPCARRRRAN